MTEKRPVVGGGRMSPAGKRALARTIRSLRAQLIDDLHDATERAYRFSLTERQARLGQSALACRRRFVAALDSAVRALPARASAADRPSRWQP